MDRKMYQLTARDEKKASRNERENENARAWADANKAKLGRKYGIRCREIARQALKGDTEYFRGMGQGRVDAANELPYSEERNDSAYNMGYHEGYTNYASHRRSWTQEIREQFDAQYVS